MAKKGKFLFIKPNFGKIPQIEEQDDVQDEDVREVIVENRSGFNLIEVVIIVIISIAFGVVVGSSLSFFRSGYDGEEMSESLQELLVVYHNILDTYYEDIDESDLVDAAIDGMVSSLDDPYSTYMDEETSDSFNQTVEGSYVGIGVTVSANETGEFVIVSVTADSPAEDIGIMVGDIILTIDQQSVSGLSLDEVTSLVKGDEGSKLKMTVLRDGKKIEKTVTRGNVDLVSVDSRVYALNNGNAGYISVHSFAANTYKQFEKELKNIENKNIQFLIIDVRSNPGGYLNQTKKILELFMKKNKVLYQVEFKGKRTKIKDSTKTSRSYPVIILINSSSASASEILASSFRDSYSDALLLGDTTYGKGTVQTAYSLSDGSSLKYTTEKWLTPSGNWIDGEGVSPDKNVLLTEEYFENPIPDNDLQLQTALDILENEKNTRD